MKPISAHTAGARRRIDGYQQVQTERKTRLQSPEARYTVILHGPRDVLDISVSEYCVADAVHKLSGNRSMVPGWCYASKDHLADSLGFTRRGIQKMIKRLKDKGILVAQEGTDYLQTTELWYESVEVFRD